MKYIVDTNVLFQQPEIIKEYECVLSSHVLREMEHLERTRKSDRTLQFEIRKAKRYLEANTTHAYYDLKDYKFTLDESLDPYYVDNILLQIAVDNGYGMITNDRLMKEKCKLYHIPLINLSEDHFVEHKGYKEVHMIESELKGVYLNLHVNHFDLLVNEYVVVNDDFTGELLDIMKWTGEYMVSIRDNKGKLGKGFKTLQFGEFKPLDEHQIMAVDSIQTNQLTQIRGRAGSGKSLITLNAAWYFVEKHDYKLVIFVNPTPLRDSQELGFYKGDRLTKLLQSAVGTMLTSKFGDELEILRQIEDGKLEILPFVDLRGYDTSGRKTIVWILEGQNLTADLMKLGMQRIGDDTKVIVDGDYHSQIDRDAYVSSNGMKRLSEVFRGEDLYGEVELQKVHRSRLADLADKM